MKHFMAALVALAAIGAAAPQAHGQEFVVVVNSANPTSELAARDVSNAFLRKAGRLSAVDLDKGSAAREAFSRSIHGRAVSAVLAYWQQQIFAGKSVPPPERSADVEVLAFVRANPNAIGYVAAGTPLGTGVKALRVK